MRYTTSEGYKAIKDLTKKRKYIEINKATDGIRWIENIGTGWRLVGFADDITRLDHRGWFTDREFQDEVYRGVVYRLPSRKSGPAYFVGYADPYNDDAACGEVRTDLEDDNAAAYAADDIAKYEAEKECEYREVWRLGQQYASTFEVVTEQRKLRSELFAELRKLRSVTNEIETPTICKTLKDKIRSTHRNIKAAYQERKEIIENHWIRNSLIEAFADGASISTSEAKEIF